MDELQLDRFVRASEFYDTWHCFNTRFCLDHDPNPTERLNLWFSSDALTHAFYERFSDCDSDPHEDDVREFLWHQHREHAGEIAEAFVEANDSIIIATGGANCILKCTFVDDLAIAGTTAHDVARLIVCHVSGCFSNDWNVTEMVSLQLKLRRERALVQGMFGVLEEIYTVSRLGAIVDLGRDAVRNFIRQAGLPVAERGKKITYNRCEVVTFLRAVVANCRPVSGPRRTSLSAVTLSRTASARRKSGN